VGLESLAEAGEGLCHPDVSQELIPPLRCQKREELGLGRVMFAWVAVVAVFSGMI